MTRGESSLSMPAPQQADLPTPTTSSTHNRNQAEAKDGTRATPSPRSTSQPSPSPISTTATSSASSPSSSPSVFSQQLPRLRKNASPRMPNEGGSTHGTTPTSFPTSHVTAGSSPSARFPPTPTKMAPLSARKLSNADMILKTSVSEATQAAAVGGVMPGAHYALCILILMNLLNFADRFVPSACKSLIQADLGLTDTQTALPMGAFLAVYMATAPIFGYLADQGASRVGLITLGLFMWSIATVMGAFATNFTQFLLARALVGVGEAAYATIAPAMLCDYFPVAQRAKILSFFYLAIPVGAALGYAVAGQIGSHYGFRSAFLVCGIPGLMLVVFVLAMKEPPRGMQDAAVLVVGDDASLLADGAALSDGGAAGGVEREMGWADTIKSLCGNSMYIYALLAVTLVSFASGGIADWLPTWLTRVQGLTIGEAGLMFGLITCVAGVGGSLTGYIIGEAMTAQGIHQPYFIIGATTQLLTCFFSSLLLLVGAVASLPTVAFIILICQFSLWLNVGGCSALIANSVHPKIRSRAFGINILISHLGGDAISPSLIGAISDAYHGDLTLGFMLVPLAFAGAAIVFALGARNVPDRFAIAMQERKEGKDGGLHLGKELNTGAADSAL
jgi:MFS family permease